ncbi:hypothetical protein MMC11_000355 [Xylographa trunciseda]|nr:hypothetical protein [Xylographa trunciseda]
MPYPTEWNISTEAEVDFSEEENLDVVEVDSLFYSDEGSTPTPNIELSEEGDNDTQMELDVVAEAVFDKQNRKIGEIDYKDEQMQTKVNLLKGEKYSLEHKTVVTKSVKIEPAEHVDLQKVDGEGGGEAMDISDDSGNFEELDENGAEVLGIEKDLHDIEAQEVKALKREPDSGISQSSFDDIERKRERLAKLKADLKSPPTLHSAKFDLKDGPVVACEMENDKNLSPFGPLSFYPVEYELQAGFSDFGARYRHKGVSLTDEEISPKNKKKIDSEQSGNAKFMYFGGTPPPFKSHEFTTAMPPGLSRGLPSPPLTEVGSDDTKREEIGIGSNVSPLWDSEPMNKQANIEDGQNAEDYMFGEKPPWYKEAGARRRRYGSVGKTKTTRFQQDVAGEFAATSQALQKWPPLMGVEAEKTGETKGIKWPGVDSPPKFSGFDEPAVVNMFSLISPQKGFRKMASLLGQGPSKPSDIPSAQNLFGYANSNDPQKGPNREKDKHIRDHVTSHTFVGHNVNSTTTTESTEHYWEAIALLRPAREKILAFEAPFDLVRLLKHVRLLYPVNPLTPDGRYDHLSFRLIRVDVSDRNNPSGFDEIASLSEAHLDGGRLQERYENEIIPRLLSLTETDRVWVTRLWVQDGRDTSNFFKLDLVFPLPQGASLGTTEYFSAQYDTTPDPPGCIRTEFEAAVLALMGGDVVDIANVQVDRYKKEWLVWTSRMDDATFLRTFLWKIDDPTINIYPPNWHPHQSFEQAEEEREARERRREREVQDGRHMLDLGSRIENPTNSQIMQDFNDAARRDQANQNQDPDIRDQLNTPQMGEQARQVGQLIIELGRQRQTLERVQRTFETANTQTAERIALLNTQNQALRSAARCHLPLGARTCNQDVFGDFQGNLYAMMLSHWRRYHLPQERRCQLHILCHANLDMLNDDELEDHREMHQIEGHAIQEGIQPTNFGGINNGMLVIRITS